MIIDTENLSTLKLHHVALLLLLYDSRTDCSRDVVEIRDVDILEALDELKKEGFIISSIYSSDHNYQPPYRRLSWSIVEKGKQALIENCVQPKSIKTVNKAAVMNRCTNLAAQLMELYPVGSKPGTHLKWRGYSKNVAERLAKLILAGNEFTDEEAIEATKAYIASFNGNYTLMRVLPYFLSKNDIKGGEVDKKCDFMEYVEDYRKNPKQASLKSDWDTTLK